jgi:hypothetical protein
MPQSQQNQDFQSLPTYRDSVTSNASWINVVMTKTEADGTTTQTSKIIAKK